MDRHDRVGDPHDPLSSAQPSTPQPRRIDRRGFLAAAGITAAGAAWAATGLAGTARAATGARGLGPAAISATGTFAVPLDSVAHTRTWMAWPDSTAIYRNKLAGLQANIALIANTIAKYEPVYLLANSASAAAAKRACTNPDVTVISTIPVDDCWMRDSGPVFRTNGAGGLDAVGLNFNGWGNEQTHAKDALVAQRVAACLGVLRETPHARRYREFGTGGQGCHGPTVTVCQ